MPPPNTAAPDMLKALFSMSPLSRCHSLNRGWNRAPGSPFLSRNIFIALTFATRPTYFSGLRSMSRASSCLNPPSWPMIAPRGVHE